MTPDIEYAKKCYSAGIEYTMDFSQYSAAYTVTNENLRFAFGFMPEKTQDVLTVSGSADHPMFARLYGAQNIDTFDITYNSKCIMDIKTAALHMMNHNQYCEFVSRLHKYTNPSQLSGIFDKLPMEE